MPSTLAEASYRSRTTPATAPLSATSATTASTSVAPPHIRTPSPSRASFSDSPPRRTMSLSRGQARLPRAMSRVLALVGIAATVMVLVSLSTRHSGPEEGVWDASSYSDRRGMSHQTGQGGLGAFKKRIWGSSPLQVAYYPPPPVIPPVREPQIVPRPNLSRVNYTTARPTHPGQSRVAIDGAPDKYIVSELPTLLEALDHLEPMLRNVKAQYPQIPQEHELWNPIFPPFLTDELKQRYRHLIEEYDPETDEWRRVERRWFLVTVCRQVAGMLADWFAMWTVLADFLGPESLAFSLMEGDSADGSGEILSSAMRAHLLYLGVPPANIHIQTHLPAIDWEARHRIEILAEMRNTALAPLYDTAPEALAPDGVPWSGVVFYNDVYLSATHVLELMHQQLQQDADMTCGWDHAGRWFYDGWVGRDMSGDLYTPFPVKEEAKDLPQVLFPSHPPTKRRYDKNLPFQVFAGWNGIAVISPRPFFPPFNVRFRRGAPASPDGSRTAAENECQMSESSFVSWDFWKYGFGRVQVVPGVHACYGKEDAQVRGWLEWPMPDADDQELIWWNDIPPQKVRCHDWPDKPGKGWWAWDTVRWVSPPAIVEL